MSKEYRLKYPTDFAALFAKGRRIEGKLFRLIWRPNRGPVSRFAFIVPRAVDKRSVVRNLLRRRARAWASPRGFGKALDIAIVFKKEAATTHRKKLYEELQRVFEKVGP